MKRGKAYAVGVGPGDPELLTLKAVRIISEADVIAAVGENPRESIAYRIAAQAVKTLADKEIIGLKIPMLKDYEQVNQINADNAGILEKYLDEGKNVAFLTIGDPTIYCSFHYIQEILKRDGYETALINGITSFCAVAAAINTTLVQWEENLQIVSAAHTSESEQTDNTNYVYMKAGKKSGEIRDLIINEGRKGFAVENCGHEDEKVFSNTDDIPDSMGYLSIVVSKNS